MVSSREYKKKDLCLVKPCAGLGFELSNNGKVLDLSLSFEDSLHADLKEGKIGIVFWLKMKIIGTDSFVYIEHIELNFWLLPTHSVP